MELTTAQQFEQERMSRAIDATNDLEVLRKLAKQLLQAWMVQRSASLWAMRSTLPRAGAVAPWDDPLA
jgi:hypothetical protein